MPVKLYLAPLRGFTDAIYRSTFARYFTGIDLAVAPFIPTHNVDRIKPSLLRDILPQHNLAMPVIPQILSKEADDFIFLARCLFDLGYETINWNLGCPYPMVAKKQRGSGLLPFPERIEQFLDKVLPAIPNRLSIKTRLGRHRSEEIFSLLPLFNRYPLTEIIIHPRIGVQMYDGRADLDMFAQCLALSEHVLVYNGDINDVATFQSFARRFAGVDRWMLGRGVLANPFLPWEIKAGGDIFETKVMVMKSFHDDLLEEYRRRFSGPAHVLDRMKGFWTYFSGSFHSGRVIMKKIHKTRRLDRYEAIVSRFFEAEAEWLS